MYIKEVLEKFRDKKIKLFVDMDGVIADYDVGVAAEYDKKRPLVSSIAKLEEISKMGNVELYILSVTRMNEGFDEKHIWLDKNAPFFKKENRVIISREANDFEASSKLKAKYIAGVERDGSVIMVIDDDPRIIKEISKTSEDVVLLKDTTLVE